VKRAALAALLVASACSKRAPIDACTDDLTGAYRTDAGERWMILDSGATLEAYTLFDDTRPTGAPAGLELGPRLLDLKRMPPLVEGEVRRRYVRTGDACIGRAPAHVVACTDDTLELVFADPSPPLGFAPCTGGPTQPSRRERWHRESQ
jgi:hypothetical protein